VHDITGILINGEGKGTSNKRGGPVRVMTVQEVGSGNAVVKKHGRLIFRGGEDWPVTVGDGKENSIRKRDQ